jgi:Fic-DOC domain mobile mystery protein B
VTDPLAPAGDGHTELSEEERAGLRLTYVTTRAELNDAEQRNITAATIRRRPPSVAQLLDDGYLRQLHRAMFSEVWTWAGQYRRRETNIGIDPAAISVEVRNLVADAAAWIEHSAYPPDELAARFHHRLVAIHPFPNGNGRHGRLAADDLAQALGSTPFTWGADLGVDTDRLRAAYLDALRAADAGSIDALVRFARS